MILLILLILLLWSIGFGFHVAGDAIHLLIVAAVILIIIEALRPRRPVE